MKIHDLPGLGATSETMLASIGITSVEDFLAKDPFEIYRQLKLNETSVSLNALYAFIGAQEGVHWQQIAKSRKAEILMRLDDMGIAPK